MAANTTIPHDIMLNIFSRLPAKSICRFRCLSKLWSRIFSTTYFLNSVNSQLHRKPDEQSVIFITRPREIIKTIDKIQLNAVSRTIDFKPSHGWFKILGSCDGLILLQTFECRVFLINPVTVEILEVPPATENRIRTHKYGFGYDPWNDEYKIVEARYSMPFVEKSKMAVEVYNVKQRVWKRVEDSPFIPSPSRYSHSAYLNGKIHWLVEKTVEAGDGYSTIAAFDLASEAFKEIPLPSGISLNRIIWQCKLVVFEGWLCIVESKCDSKNDIWIMKQYEVAESWTKYTFFGDFFGKNLKPLCSIKDDEMLLSSLNKLQVYNFNELSLRDAVIDAGPHTVVYDEAWPFVGSILSPSVGSRLSE
ncbi:hypothetical protein ABFS82_06G155700 [Erythranthe guttata]|uniref:F-box domain-containing protein n=1 Tax=Erythranthe guttata TaxID=4155 RepID=A0A022RA16_ERYGU|nr:PREDICTED: F-box/kelch-repeat protein At3g06240-like [Erythranthe guttata]EYU37192.1 hypothetical protein MIMGU_mgv1a022458mg [Erythranthe guttata]|eukprot:XP_012837716.1 PREDICTED: F-box/kelch-repeat protein At3g06240-like [Erythranthe guttata]